MHSGAHALFSVWYDGVMETNTNKTAIIGIAVLVVVGAVLAYFYMKKEPAVPTLDAAQGVLPSIGEAGNPLTDKPDLNPTSKTNPFDSVKTNPFD